MIYVTISLVSCNQRHDLERLLPSLAPAAIAARAEILLVDNRSTDGTSEWMRLNYPAVNTLFNPNRAGYGENHNLNLRRAQGEYFVIMNADMTVEVDVFSVLRDYMNRHSEAGMVAPKILNPDGTIQGLIKRYPTVWDLFLRRCLPRSLRSCFRQRMDHYEMRDVGYDRECDVPFLSGAFMFCRTDVLRSLGGFDPGYFLYFEDADLCRRVQRTHRTMYLPEAKVFHFWQRSAHKKLIFTWYFVRSAARYFWKWGLKLW
ncbi:MAG: glycosyltransferase family 2 protein [Candidatus Omnitrophota bacterium]